MNEHTFESELREHGKIIYTNVGKSMMPLLRENRDVMIIERNDGRLKKYDCPLYRRSDGSYILHRILKVRENDYVICGDHCTKKEYGVTDAQILGVLTGIIRNGKTISTTAFSYKVYYHLWCDLYYLRVLILKTKAFIRKPFSWIKRKISKKANKT